MVEKEGESFQAQKSKTIKASLTQLESGALVDGFIVNSESFIAARECYQAVEDALYASDFPDGDLDNFLDTVAYFGERGATMPFMFMIETSSPNPEIGFNVFGQLYVSNSVRSEAYQKIQDLEPAILKAVGNYRSYTKAFDELENSSLQLPLMNLINYSLDMGEMNLRGTLQRNLLGQNQLAHNVILPQARVSPDKATSE